jgi:hypothetical protein
MTRLWPILLVACNGPATDSDGDAPPSPSSGHLEPLYEPSGEGFWSMPWPSDERVGLSGNPVLNDFPESDQDLIGNYLNVIESKVVGYSTSPVIYLPFDKLPSADDLPTPITMLEDDAPVYVMGLGEHCGERMPFEVTSADKDDFMTANSLALAPVQGFVLPPGTTWAAVVTTSLGTGSGLTTSRPDGFEAAMSGDSEMAVRHKGFRDCLDELGVSHESIAVATVFTTQTPIDELVTLRAHVVDPAFDVPVIAEFAEVDALPTNTWRGMYDTPIFQAGVSPYAASGGGFVFDATGEPVVQTWEGVPFSVTVPDGDGPFPVLLWEDGTGATLLHHLATDPILDALAAGFAVASFEPQFHGDRASPGSNPVAHTFNDFNPASGRSALRQQVIDTAYFIRVLRETDLSAAGDLDTTTIVYGGQSQGAIVGALTAGVETEITAYALNGVGGYLSQTVVERTDPTDINGTLQVVLGIPRPLTRFHPVVALVQLGSDVTDPLNTAHRWRGWDGHAAGNNLLLLNGQQDHTTPERGVAAITIAGDAAPIQPVGFEVDPYGLWDVADEPSPVKGNTSSVDGTPLTIGTIVDGDLGHFVIYEDAEARAAAIGFWTSALSGTPEVVR